ncbi:uncharacterized protein DDB_G0283357 isoform X1 [Drosophila miranda]|uniref:uncharacterized protein DDB_G0283357 isoform X1 n=1 Tax=Drosophila miranda TaxID=7229 RepID=UPI0007E60317|nr:uncharacterized protein DDB_G0283357 isoform X1 [Drosophila miranda]
MLLPCVLLLIIGHGLCRTLPQQKLRVIRDTRNLPTDLFKPVGNGGGKKSIANEGQNGTVILEPTDGVEFLEKTEGEVAAVSESEESESNPPWPNYPHNSFFSSNFSPPPVFNGRNVMFPPNNIRPNPSPSFNGNNFPTSSFPNNPNTFPPLSGTFHSSGLDPRFGVPYPSGASRNPVFSGGYGGSPNSIAYPSGVSSMTPFFSGSGPIGSSSSNFQRSEHYSYTSDGNGPPQVEHNVFDSRTPRFGSSSMSYF